MSMKMFNHESNIILRSVPDHNMIDHIPPAVYRLRENPMEGEVYLIKDRDNFKTPPKFYGMHETNKRAILAAWEKAEGSTGVLLRGIKGAGKSALGEDLGNSLLKRDIPVIMVDKQVSRQALTLVTKMAGPACCVYFDEFGKTFGASERRDLLTYFSDTSFGKVLFIVTSNSKKELDKYMLDRPGRFLFRIDYKRLDPIAISEMIDDHGLTPEMSVMLNAYVENREVTFDMLRFLAPIAAECSDPLEFNRRISILNCPPPVYANFNVTKVLFKGQEFYGFLKGKDLGNRRWSVELLEEGSPEPVYKGEFGYDGKHQVMAETMLFRDIQFFVDDVVIVGVERYGSSIQEKIDSRFHDPFKVKEEQEQRDAERSSHDSMLRRHIFGGMHVDLPSFMTKPSAELSDEQKQLLAMAQHIVDTAKQEPEAAPAPAVEESAVN